MCRTSLSHLQTWPVSRTGLPGHTEVDCSVVLVWNFGISASLY